MTKETPFPQSSVSGSWMPCAGCCILCMVAIHAFWDLSAFGGLCL